MEEVKKPTALDHFTEIQHTCLEQNITMLTAFSHCDAANYLSQLKTWGSKHRDSSSYLGENKRNETHTKKAVEVLASVMRMQERDANTMLKSYGNLRNVILLKDYNELLSFKHVGMNKIEAISRVFKTPINSNSSK